MEVCTPFEERLTVSAADLVPLSLPGTRKVKVMMVPGVMVPKVKTLSQVR